MDKVRKSSQKAIDKATKWNREHKERHGEAVKRYYAKNKEKLYAHQKCRYLEVKDSLNARKRERQANDPNYRILRKKYKKNWETKYPERVKEKKKGYGRTAYLKTRETRLDNDHEKNKNRRLEVIYHYSNGSMSCAYCGESAVEFLSIDHINNDGGSERKIYKGNLISHIIRQGFQEKYQILCHNCNMIKGINLRTRKDQKASYHTYRDKVKKTMLNVYSNGTNQCECCGFSDQRALTFNHLTGGGCKELRENGTHGIALYKLYKKGIRRIDINVLCMNCNKALGHYGECPHKTKQDTKEINISGSVSSASIPS